MKTKISLCLVFAIVMMALPIQTHAQFGKLLKKAKNKAKEVISSDSGEEDSVDEQIDIEEIPEVVTDTTTDDSDYDEADTNSDSNNVTKENLAQLYLLKVSEFLVPVNRYLIIGANGDDMFLTKDVEPEVAAHFKSFKGLMKDLQKESEDPEVINALYDRVDMLYRKKERISIYTFDEVENDMFLLEKFIIDMKSIDKYIVKNNPEFSAIIPVAEKMLVKLTGKASQELNAISTNPMHQKYLNKIAFTNNRNINPLTASASEYKDKFVAGEEIYGVFFSDQKVITQKLIEYEKPEVRMRSKNNSNLEVIFWLENKMFPIKSAQNYIVFPIVTDGKGFVCHDTHTHYGIEDNMKALYEFSPRPVLFEVWFEQHNKFHKSNERIEGQLTIDFSEGDQEKYMNMANAIKAKCGR